MDIRAALALCLALLPIAVRGEVTHSAADGFTVEHRFSIAATPSRAWQALIHPERWWPEDHTWSGARTNLNLEPRAGGCFCEIWAGGSAEHARIVMAVDEQTLRMRGSLGPLQEMAVTGVLTVALAAKDRGTDAVVTYRVSGDSRHQLAGLAPTVDQVIGLQFGALAAHAAGRGDEPEE